MTTTDTRALDRRIAQKREPKPKNPSPESQEAIRGFKAYILGRPIKSPGGAWLLVYNYENGNVPEWEPRAYTTDPAASDELLDALTRGPRFHTVYIIDCGHGGCTVQIEREDGSHGEVEAADRKLAIALAYDKATD